MFTFTLGEVLYWNSLASPECLADFRAEGQPVFSFPRGALRLESLLDPALGQKANFLWWCRHKFPADLAAAWDFQPLYEPGLAMFWFCADGAAGRDLFDPALKPRDGQYEQYHTSDLNGYHTSYFRRGNPKGERGFHTCNLRKSCGFHLVCQGADPLPSVADARGRYRIQVVKCGGVIRFSVDELLIYQWRDDGNTYGPVLGAGYIGFRQMSPLIAEYANLEVRAVTGA